MTCFRSTPRRAAVWLVVGAALSFSTGTLAAQDASARSATPVAAVQRVLKAVADSSHSELALAWGTANGPASKIQPQEWQRRVAIMQSFLQKADYRIIGEDASAPAGDVRTVLVEQRRKTCVKTMPFVASKMGDGSWIVSNIDLSTGLPPGKSCEDPGAKVQAAN